MPYLKYIYWRPDVPRHDGRRFANVHVIAPRFHGTLEEFERMNLALKETFPEALHHAIICTKIIDSELHRGAALIIWFAYLPENTYRGWEQIADGTCSYSWS